MHQGQTVSLDKQTEIFGQLLDYWELGNPSIVAHDFGGAITLRAHLLGGYDFKRYALLVVVALAPWDRLFSRMSVNMK